MNVSLRAPVAADYAVLASWIPSAAACARWAGPNLRFPFTADELPGLLQVERGWSYGMIAPDHALLGFGQFWPRDERTAHLGRIIVSPVERGRGLGRILLSSLIGEAIGKLRPDRITLRVYRDNSPALSLYASLGFEAVEAESNPEVLTMEMRTTSNTTFR